MGKYIEWDMQQHPNFFKSSPSGKYTDLSIVRHVVSNVNPPDGEVDEAFMKILNAVAEEVDLIPALDDVVKVVRCKECYIPTPPEVDEQYMAELGTDRADKLRVFHGKLNHNDLFYDAEQTELI